MSMQAANAAKASFDDIYVKEDPRDYYSVLGSLDYAIPDLAQPILRQIASAWRRAKGRAATILDLGSSYGVNAALFRYPLTFDMLRRRYARREMMALSAAQVRDLDRHYFSAWPRARAEKIIACDISRPAVDYAVEAGLADLGVACNFEADEPPGEAMAQVASADIIVSTGAVGYVTARTFDRLMATTRDRWVVSFCLRMFDFEPIAAALGARGLATEKLQSAAFVQRRFRDAAEAEKVLALLSRRGLDPAGLEAEGLLFAELFVSRPPEDVAALPLEEMVTIASGRHMSFGPRLLQVRRDGRPALAPIRT